MRKNQPLTLHKSRYNNGFSLIEILAAMLILSIALLGLVSVSISTLRYSNYVKNRTIAITLAQNKIDDLQRLANIGTITNANNSTENYIDENGNAGGIFTRAATISGGAGQLTIVNVTLTWTGHKTNTVTQTTMLSQ